MTNIEKPKNITEIREQALHAFETEFDNKAWPSNPKVPARDFARIIDSLKSILDDTDRLDELFPATALTI
jgi:hypothetical protein